MLRAISNKHRGNVALNHKSGRASRANHGLFVEAFCNFCSGWLLGIAQPVRSADTGFSDTAESRANDAVC